VVNKATLASGHTVHVVDEACGFGSILSRVTKGRKTLLCREAAQTDEHMYPGVGRDDPRGRHLALSADSRATWRVTRAELAMIRVPTEAAGNGAHVPATPNSCASSTQARDRGAVSLLINQVSAPEQLGKKSDMVRDWSKLLPAWICLRLEVTGRLCCNGSTDGMLSAAWKAAASGRDILPGWGN